MAALGADATGKSDISGVLSSANADGNWDSSGIIHVSAGTYRISKSISLSKPVSFASGAKFSIDSGVTVTFNALVSGPASSQLFTGSGSIAFGYGVQGSVLVEWFGAKGNGATDDTVAINRAMKSDMGYRNVIFSASKTYRISSTITVPDTAIVQSASSVFVYLQLHGCAARPRLSL